MQSDITRNTFDALKHYSRVIHQQGRVPLDANWNEQTEILLHYLRALAEDLIGPHGGPEDRSGFEIMTNSKQLDDFTPSLTAEEKKTLNTLLKDGPLIGPGRYYVEGWLCENEDFPAFLHQHSYPITGRDLDDYQKLIGQPDPLMLYLDLWERNITWIEDDQIREVALGGPDTAARAKVVSQVRARGLTNDENVEVLKLPSAPTPAQLKKLCMEIATPWGDWKKLRQQNRGLLKAEVKPQAPSLNPCITSPESRYRGVENQLYRVEIHKGGKTTDNPTFKWSRENGSVVAAWLGNEGDELIVAGTRDQARGFTSGNWIELIHDELDLKGEPGTLVKLTSVKGDRLRIDASGLGKPIAWSKDFVHPKVRRWDQTSHPAAKLEAGAIPIVEAGDDKGWIALEDGIQIQFQKPAAGQNEYRTGDYWLIPARVASGDIEWPKEKKSDRWVPRAVKPHGIEHRYAPLAIVKFDAGTKTLNRVADLRHEFKSLGIC